MRTHRVAAILIGLTLCQTAWAEDDEYGQGGQLFAIQNRKHLVSHEFTLGVGTVPLDAFYKGLTGSFGYTYHFSDLWAWEVVQGTYSFNIDTDLKDQLLTDWGVEPTDFPELLYFVGSNVVFKPVYGKAALLNDGLIYGELFFTAGANVAEYENGGFFVGGNIGAGLRVYLSQYFAVRFEIRDYQFISAETLFSDTKNELFLQMALGLNLQ